MKSCNNCRHRYLPNVYEPCHICNKTTNSHWEPAEEEKLCRTCGVASIEDQMTVCTHCYDHSKWRPKEDKKMHEVKVMEAKEVIPEEPRVSHLGQTALNTLVEIYNKLSAIEDFIDTPPESRASTGDLACPNNLIHNLQLINGVANSINQRLDKLQEKL